MSNQYVDCQKIGNCHIHGLQFSYIYFDQITEPKLICNECRDYDSNKYDQSQLVLLTRLFKQPEVFCSRILEDKNADIRSFFQNMSQIQIETTIQQIDRLHTEIQQLKTKIDEQCKWLLSFRDDLINNVKEMRKKLLVVLQMDKYLNQIVEDQQNSDITKTHSIIKQNKEQLLGNYINEIKKQISTFQNLKGEYLQTFKTTVNCPPNIEQLQNVSLDLFKQYRETVANLIQGFNGEAKRIIEEKKMNEFLRKLSNNGKPQLLKQFNPNQQFEQFWSIAENKSKLLMIFQGNNNQIFGGYSSQQWTKSVRITTFNGVPQAQGGPPQALNNQFPPPNQQQMRGTMGALGNKQASSFLFFAASQHDEFIQAQLGQGPNIQAISSDQFHFSFGKEDLSITIDFKRATSKLTNYYFQNHNKQSLFDKNQEYIEIKQVEIYEILDQ